MISSILVRIVMAFFQNEPKARTRIEDVMKIKDAFEKHSVPLKEYSKPGELIALRHAVKNYLGYGAGLASVIRAVVDGSLVPGCTTRFRGITGYLFRSEDFRKYRPAPDIAASPEGLVNYKGSGSFVGGQNQCHSRPNRSRHA